jgi:hypothetical protein
MLEITIAQALTNPSCRSNKGLSSTDARGEVLYVAI